VRESGKNSFSRSYSRERMMRVIDVRRKLDRSLLALLGAPTSCFSYSTTAVKFRPIYLDSGGYTAGNYGSEGTLCKWNARDSDCNQACSL
jgi:hypothetical protein